MNDYLDFLEVSKAQNESLDVEQEQRKGSKKKKDDYATSLSLLKTRLTLLPEFDSSDVTEELIVSCLHARQRNVDAALELVCQAHIYNLTCLTAPLNEEHIFLALENCLPSVLDKKDQWGRPIIVVYANHWSPETLPFEIFHRAFTLTLDMLLMEKKNQESGVVVVTDWTDFTFKQCMKIPAAGLKTLVHHFHKAYPVKFHACHFVNQPWYVSGILTVLRQFTTVEEASKLYLHGNNLSTLHDHIPKECLPAELGGECAPHNPRVWAETMKGFLADDSSQVNDESGSLWN
ncbi:clavesin-2-like isoform X2 [Artemia franciscana]|nr:hypothetical protein QYM36_000551 [Artemia franciscana]